MSVFRYEKKCTNQTEVDADDNATVRQSVNQYEAGKYLPRGRA
jgi:hypothetical protein